MPSTTWPGSRSASARDKVLPIPQPSWRRARRAAPRAGCRPGVPSRAPGPCRRPAAGAWRPRHAAHDEQGFKGQHQPSARTAGVLQTSGQRNRPQYRPEGGHREQARKVCAHQPRLRAHMLTREHADNGCVCRVAPSSRMPPAPVPMRCTSDVLSPNKAAASRPECGPMHVAYFIASLGAYPAV